MIWKSHGCGIAREIVRQRFRTTGLDIWLTDYNVVLARYSEVVVVVCRQNRLLRRQRGGFDSGQGIVNFLGQKKVMSKHKVLCISYLAMV